MLVIVSLILVPTNSKAVETPQKNCGSIAKVMEAANNCLSFISKQGNAEWKICFDKYIIEMHV